MSLKFVVMADTHLPDVKGTAQYAALDWAIDDINKKQPQFAIMAGDITATGDICAFDAFSEKIKELKVPSYIVIGNSDLRTAANIGYAQKQRSGYTIEVDNTRIVCLNTPDANICESDRQEILKSGDGAVMVLHHSLEGLNADSREFLTNWASTHKGYIIHAHSHRNRDYYIEKTRVFGIRCIDPDKSIENPPCISYFEIDGEELKLTESCFDFPRDNMGDFREKLGISCFHIYDDIDFAMQNNIKNIEIRTYDGSDEELEFLKEKVAQWRVWGGACVSVHMPNLKWNGEGVDGIEMWNKAVRIARELKVETVTVHPPRYVRIGDMNQGGEIWNFLTEYFYERISELLTTTNVGIENIHSSDAEIDDENRCFGYKPEEILGFVDELNKKFGYERVGVVFDIGHAKNNGPHAARNTIGVWEKLVGQRTTAYHIHQVIMTEHGMENHTAITNWAGGPYICYSTFMWSWQNNVVNHKPMFMEMRKIESCETSIKALDKYIEEYMPQHKQAF